MIKKYFNAKQTDSLYALGGEQSKAALTPESFGQVSNTQLYPLGEIKESSQIGFNDNISIYKLRFNSAVLQMLIGPDDGDKLQTFLFQPYSRITNLTSPTKYLVGEVEI